MEQHSEINPGYTAKVSSKKLDIDVGPIIRCPRCKKPLMEGCLLKNFRLGEKVTFKGKIG